MADSESSSRRGLQFARRLRVDDTGLRIGQQSLRQRHLLGVRRADGTQVGDPVQNGHVGHPEGARQLPRRLQPARHAQVRQDGPRLVDHQEEATSRRDAPPALTAVRASAACSQAVAQAIRTPSAADE